MFDQQERRRPSRVRVPMPSAVPVAVALPVRMAVGLLLPHDHLQLHVLKRPLRILASEVPMRLGPRIELPLELDLEGRVTDAGGLGCPDGQIQHLRAVLLPLDEQMSGAQHVLRAHRPHVQIVDRRHVRNLAKRCGEQLAVHVIGRLHHQGVQGLQEGRSRSQQHEDSEEHRARGVRIVPPAHALLRVTNVERLDPYEQRRDTDAQRLHDVADHVGHGGLHGEATAPVAMAAGAMRMAMTAAVVVP
mmetsp:Transcript_116938/g.325133  ORF Transcript_116938/g.325133 Transcript_116938/m.325133 type:complete len:246 (-) Transcript_116938:223-960(-)